MKVPKARAAENRQGILDAASRLYRERGLTGVGVADITRNAGVTPGGLYRHFASTDALAVDAARAGGGLSEVFAEGIERNIQRFAQLLVDSRAEAGSATVRSQDRERAIQVLATMVGGLVLARATAAAQPALSDELLTTLQTQLIGLLGEEPR